MRNKVDALTIPATSQFPLRLAAYTLLLWATWSMPAGAYDWYVDHAATGAGSGASWTDAFLRLEDAIAVAIPGDRIFIADGVYSPPGGPYPLPDGVSLSGGHGGTTTLDGAGVFHVLMAMGSGSQAARVTNCTITGGDANGATGSPDARGGGAYIRSFRVTFTNCVFQNNRAQEYGGAVYLSWSESEFVNCRFLNNESSVNGGAVCVSGGSGKACATGRPLFKNCDFEENLAVAGNGGGADLHGTFAEFQDSRFKLNEAAQLSLLACATGLGVSLLWQYHAVEQARVRADIENCLSRAQILQSEGRYDAALAETDKLLEYDPAYTQGQLLKARLLYALDRPDDALAVLETLAESRPAQGAAHYLLSLIYRERDPPRAAHHQAVAERLLVDSADAYHLRSLASPTLELSLSCLNHGLRLDPSHEPSVKTRALVHHALQDYVHMEQDALMAVTLRPKDGFSWSLLGIARRQLGKLNDALADLDRAVELKPGDPEIHSQRRETHHLLGRHQEAVSDARAALACEPESQIFGFYLIRALLLSGDVNTAQSECERRFLVTKDLEGWFRPRLAHDVFGDLGRGQSFKIPNEGSGDLAGFLKPTVECHEALSRKARPVARGAYNCSWFPDGKHLLCDTLLYPSLHVTPDAADRFRAPTSLSIVNLESGQSSVIIETGKDGTVSPDGRWIAFVREPRFNQFRSEEIWIVAARGGQPRRLALGGFPSWSRNPQHLYFQSREKGMLCRIDPDDPGAAVEDLVRCSYFFPSVSPDGDFVAYALNNQSLVVREIPSGRDVLSVPFVVSDGGFLVSWLATGHELALGTYEFHHFGLWIFDLATREARKVLDGPATLARPSPDGSKVAFAVRDKFSEVWIADLKPGLSIVESLAPGVTVAEYLKDRENALRDQIRANPGGAYHVIQLADFSRTTMHYAEAAGLYREAFDLTRRTRGWLLAQSAEMHMRRGDAISAVRVLEEALRMHLFNGPLMRDLAAYRLRIPERLPCSYASVDHVLDAQYVPLLRDGESAWRFHRGSVPPAGGKGWIEIGYDDTSWEVGKGAFSYGKREDRVSAVPNSVEARRTIGIRLDDMKDSYTTLYVRRTLDIQASDAFTDYELSIKADDGFVAYVNGVEVGRVRAGEPGVDLDHKAVASAVAPAAPPFEVIRVPRHLIRPGRNVLAILALNAAIDSSDFYLSVLFRGKPPPGGARDRAYSRRLAAQLEASRARELSDYLEGMILERDRKFSEAAARFRAVLLHDRSLPEPCAGLARCLYASGETSAARQVLEEELRDRLSGDVLLWDTWWRHVVIAPALETAAALQTASAIGGNADIRKEDLCWVLSSLGDRGAIRMNCGGARYADSRGAPWEPDRFFNRGWSYGESLNPQSPRPYGGDIAGTTDAPLYQTERWFPPDEQADAVYCIPLPVGCYRITLHFAAISRPMTRVFDVSVEGRVFLKDFAMASLPFATAHQEHVETRIEDGFLDLEFIHRNGQSSGVSAIEITSLK